MADTNPSDTPTQNSEKTEVKFAQAAKRVASEVTTESCAACSNHHGCALMKLKLAPSLSNIRINPARQGLQ
jgi:hypothetical protein